MRVSQSLTNHLIFNIRLCITQVFVENLDPSILLLPATKVSEQTRKVQLKKILKTAFLTLHPKKVELNTRKRFVNGRLFDDEQINKGNIDLRAVSYLMPLSSSTQGKTDVEPARVVGQQVTPSHVLLQKLIGAEWSGNE